MDLRTASSFKKQTTRTLCYDDFSEGTDGRLSTLSIQ